MPLHDDAFRDLDLTSEQQSRLAILRDGAAAYARMIDYNLADGPDKTFVLRNHRTSQMWAEAAIVKLADGRARGDE